MFVNGCFKMFFENLLFERSEFKFSSVFAYFFGNAKSMSLPGLRAKA